MYSIGVNARDISKSPPFSLYLSIPRIKFFGSDFKPQAAKANGEHKKNGWEIIDVPNLY